MNRLHFDSETHTYWMDGVAVPSVTQVLKEMGLIDTSWYTPEDARFGNFVHETTAMFDRGELDEDTLDPMLRPYLDAWQSFLTAVSMDVIDIEQPVFNEVYRFAGTPDRVVILDAIPTVIEIKTGATLPWHVLQTAGYALCCSRWVARTLVYLGADGKFRIGPPGNSSDGDIFLSFLACRNWCQRNGVKAAWKPSPSARPT